MNISDKTLTVLFALAILTSIGGMLVVLSTLDFRPAALITGLVTGNTSGKVNVTVSSTVTLTLTKNYIDFGSGTLRANATANATTALNTTDTCPSATGFCGTGTAAHDFELRNDGNVDVNVSINGSTAAQFYTASGSTYRFAARNASTLDGFGCRANITTGTPTTMSNTLTSFCTNLTFADANDTVNISIFLEIRQGEPTGEKIDANVIFFANSV